MSTKLKTPKELGITARQFKNICKLVTFVRTSVPPPDFDIRTFCTLPDGQENIDPAELEYECGTSACFCGYGPLAGIRAKRDEDWWEYQTRVFGSGKEWGTHSARIFRLLFEQDHTNTRDAAVRRGAYFLTRGIPKGAVDLATWEAPKSFRPNYKLIAEHAK